MQKLVFTIDEAAEYLCISPRLVQQLAHVKKGVDGTLKHFHPGDSKNVRFFKPVLDQWILENHATLTQKERVEVLSILYKDGCQTESGTKGKGGANA